MSWNRLNLLNLINGLNCLIQKPFNFRNETLSGTDGFFRIRTTINMKFN